MALEVDIADYIEWRISSLVVDENLFVGEEVHNSPDACVTVVGSSGTDSESGLETRAFQIIVKDTAYIDTQDLALEVHALFKNKPGFPDIIEDVFYCEVLTSPQPIDRDARGRYIFTSNYIIRKREDDEVES